MLVSTMFFTSCEDHENIMFDPETGQTLIKFVGDKGVIPVNSTGVSSSDVSIEVTTVSDVDRTVNVVVDASSTATADQYMVTEFVIPAGEYTATGTVTGVYSTLPATGAVQLVLKIDGISSGVSVSENDLFTFTLERFCPLVLSEFYGTYTQLGGFDGGAPGARVDATVSAGPVAGTLLISNLYSSGRGAVIELDYSDVTMPKVIHRSEEFGVVFSVQSLGNTFTEDVLGDVDKNTFSTCNKEIRLFFYRRIQQPDGRYYGGSYEVILTKQ